MQPGEANQQLGKIIHIDMDCFYAAVEMRERPELSGQPVAVGGKPGGRGVLTTCNYVARKYGCRSAMPSFKALELCPELIILPVRHELYRREANRIRSIFGEFTPTVEPLSLDEAYLDLAHLNSKGSSLAREIRFRIKKETGLTASAGIAPNKLLAKIASDWNKPDGQFEIPHDQVFAFMQELSVSKIWGVGKKTEERLSSLGVKTCGDLQKLNLVDLHMAFGRFGGELYRLCRGVDQRKVMPNRERKSLSVERTFPADLATLEQGELELDKLLSELLSELSGKHKNRVVCSAFVKVKFTDFRQTTVECRAEGVDQSVFSALVEEGWIRGGGKSVRLLGAGVRFRPRVEGEEGQQLELFDGVS
ncbi:MAG: DNA polymerase IV [Verrucomicrobiaceae bacterium]|nr:DNA polymerase IV [Verrucomicrobiaceae bacterium]